MSKGYKLIVTAIIILLVLLNLIIFLKTFIKEPDSENITFQYFYRSQEQISKIHQNIDYMKFNPQLYSGIDSSLINLFQNNNKPILVYYFSTEMCSPCLEDIKDTIQSVFPDYKIRNDILFLSNDLELRLRNNYFGKKVACTKDQNIISIFNQYHVPTFFMVDTSLRIHNVLVASKQTPVITRNYLNIVKKRYLHK